MPVWGIVLLCLAGLLVLASLVLSVAMFRYAFLRKVRKREDSDYGAFQGTVDVGVRWFEAQPFEELYETSFDGLRLYGRLLCAKEPRGTIVMMHGYHGDALNDFAPEFQFCYERGYNLLVPDERTHGNSEGTYITFGVKERRDCAMWAAYARERFGERLPIFLYGLSMGCATVLMATELELPENVRGVIADCGFTEPWAITAHVLRNMMHLPVFPTLYLAGVYTHILAGFGLHEQSAERAMKKNVLPVLFFHGTADDFVPLWMGQANYAACRAEKTQVLVEGAAHAQSFLVEPERCLGALSRFLEQHTA